MNNDQLTIDPAFEGLCPRLTPEEFNCLQQSILDEGCREPITVWANHEDTVIDGHNRYRICKNNSIPYKTRAIKLDTCGDVINWIITNQLGRRNLSDEQKSYLRGKRYRQEQKAEGRPEKRGHSDHVSGPQRTGEKIAQELGVVEATIRRDAKFADAVDKVAESAGPDAKAAILSGELGVSKAGVQKLAQLPAQQQMAAIKGGKDAVKSAIAGTDGSPKVKHKPTEAMQLAAMAVSQLERIRDEDPKRDDALDRVAQWICDNRR